MRPDLVVLVPYKNFIVRSLSGKLVVHNKIISFIFTVVAGKSNKENDLKTLCLFLGPDFIAEYIAVSISQFILIVYTV